MDLIASGVCGAGGVLVGGRGEGCMCAFFLLPLCLSYWDFFIWFWFFFKFFFSSLLHLIVDVYLMLLFSQKVVWSPTWLFVGNLFPRNVFTCVYHISHRLLHGRYCIQQDLATTFVGRYFGLWREQSTCLYPSGAVSTLTEIQQQMHIW